MLHFCEIPGRMHAIKSYRSSEFRAKEAYPLAAINILTNYFNHVAHTDVGFPLVDVNLPAVVETS